MDVVCRFTIPSDPLGLPMSASRFAGAPAKDPIGLPMGASRFAGAPPKDPIGLPMGASRCAGAPRYSGNKAGRLAPHTPKKGDMGYRKNTPTRGKAATPPPSRPAPLRLSPAAPAFSPADPPIVPVALVPASSTPSLPAECAEAWTPGKEIPNAVKKEHVIFIQRLFKQGLSREVITGRMAAEYPNLCKGHRNGFKVATEETRVESISASVFQYTISYAEWLV